MTSRRSVLAGLLALAAASFLLALRGHALADVDDALEEERGSLARTTDDLAELLSLRAKREVVAAAKRPTQDVLALLNSSLRDAGVPVEHLKSLEPETDVPLAGRLRSQALRSSLEHLTLPEVGAFLDDLRSRQSVWVPSSVELTHATVPDGRTDLYDLRLGVTATYLSDLADHVGPDHGAPR